MLTIEQNVSVLLISILTTGYIQISFIEFAPLILFTTYIGNMFSILSLYHYAHFTHETHKSNIRFHSELLCYLCALKLYYLDITKS